MPRPERISETPKPSTSPTLAKSCCGGRCNIERTGESCYQCKSTVNAALSMPVPCYCGQFEEMRDAPPISCYSAGGGWVLEGSRDIPIVPKPPAVQPYDRPNEMPNFG